MFHRRKIKVVSQPVNPALECPYRWSTRILVNQEQG